jgi:hypothetical protein
MPANGRWDLIRRVKFKILGNLPVRIARVRLRLEQGTFLIQARSVTLINAAGSRLIIMTYSVGIIHRDRRDLNNVKGEVGEMLLSGLEIITTDLQTPQIT